MKRIFIDTEFTDSFDLHLVSIGLVSSAGEEFYAEVPFPDASCSAFVREAVIPLLGRIPDAVMSKDSLCQQLLAWLSTVRLVNSDIEICFDYQTDWDLFIDAIDYHVPVWCRPCLIASNINEVVKYEFYKKHALPQHHALYDARANLAAFQESDDGRL
ncbi:3'-5' exoribonuclease [Undibacterium sp. CY18W]|uniref:3'-5' exoribonuclease n=1 Tax=Undibacterium hunanense TaxID=2762292 RepID=A0ABR6ZW07_9BURK|nr:3'-5' exoribonuclease [Undibacterium hunanense]MBC3920061.1 3'-5' exoribonuclease [Undibacterium hunanense]